MRAIRLGAVVLFVLVAVAGAQSLVTVQGRVVDVSSAWATSPYGDQSIVSTVTVRSAISDLIVEVPGGTINGVTLTVSDVDVPKVGEIVRLARSHGRWRIQGGVDRFVAGASTWPSSSMSWLLDALNQDMDPALVERDAVAASRAWTDQARTSFVTTYAGQVPFGSGVQALDYQNTVLFRPTLSPEGYALASAYCWWNGSTRLDCDIVNWDGKVWFWAADGPCSGPDAGYLQDILTHEFGHAVGLEHTPVTDATMYPGYPYCSTNFRTLAPDDIAGIEALYPVASEPVPEPTPDPRPCKKRGRWAC